MQFHYKKKKSIISIGSILPIVEETFEDTFVSLRWGRTDSLLPAHLLYLGPTRQFKVGG